jgi:hypothetical protein
MTLEGMRNQRRTLKWVSGRRLWYQTTGKNIVTAP